MARGRPDRIGVVAVLGAAVLAAGCSTAVTGPRTPSMPAPKASPSVRYPLGAQVFAAPDRLRLPPLQGTTLDGSRLAVSGYLGRVTVVNVWSSWCEPCRTESPALAAFAVAQGPAGVRVVGLDENDVLADALSFSRSAGSTYPSLRDDGSLLATLDAWLPPALPGTLVVDGRGRVAARVVGAVSQRDLTALVAAVAHPPA